MKAEAEWQRSLKRDRCFVRKIGIGSFKKRRKSAIHKVAISKESDRNVSYL